MNPKIRMAMHILTTEASGGKEGRIVVLEMRDGVLLSLAESGSSIENKLRLTTPEARALAQHLRKIASRVDNRTEDMP